MYESPIEIITTGVHLLVEENVYKTVTKLGINVDKEGLLRALQYDREQYQKGYDDGCKKAIKEFARALRQQAFDRLYVSIDEIDNLVKEMVGEDK
jgi:hypothetical protein